MENSNKKIETKIVRTNDEHRCIYVNESFGWRYSSDSRDGNVSLITFTREILNSEEFKQIIVNENEYYNLTFNKYYEEQKKLNIPLLIILLLLGIIPGIIYLVIHFATITQPKITKEEYQVSVNEFWRKSNILLWESRRLSFNSKNLNLLDYSKSDTNTTNDDPIYYKEGLVVKDITENGKHYGGLWQIYGDEHILGNNTNSLYTNQSKNANGKPSKTNSNKNTIPAWILIMFVPFGFFIWLASRNKK